MSTADPSASNFGCCGVVLIMYIVPIFWTSVFRVNRYETPIVRARNRIKSRGQSDDDGLLGHAMPRVSTDPDRRRRN